MMVISQQKRCTRLPPLRVENESVRGSWALRTLAYSKDFSDCKESDLEVSA